MGHREACCLGYCRMPHKHVVHFLRHDFFSATINKLLETARDKQISISIHKPLVARPEPAMGESTLVSRRIIVIILDDTRTTYHDLANGTRWQQRTLLIHNGHLWTHC